MKIKQIILIIVLSITTVCSPKYARDFDLVKKNYKLKPAAGIVVLPGSLHDRDLLLASLITNHLKEESSFKVVPYDTMEKKIPDYKHIMTDFPVPMSDGSKSIKEQVYYLSPNTIRNVSTEQKKFNTKYVYLVWSSGILKVVTRDNRGGGSTSYYIHVYGRLIEYPQAKIVGYSINEYRGGDSFCFLFNIVNIFLSETAIIEDFFEDTAETIVDEIVTIAKKSEKK